MVPAGQRCPKERPELPASLLATTPTLKAHRIYYNSDSICTVVVDTHLSAFSTYMQTVTTILLQIVLSLSLFTIIYTILMSITSVRNKFVLIRSYTLYIMLPCLYNINY